MASSAEFFDIAYQLTVAKQKPGYTTEKHLKKFSEMKTNLDRMNFVWKDLEEFKVFPPFEKKEKNDITSAMIRETGNEYFCKGKYRNALDEYTKSVLMARSPAVMALAFANRSAALQKIGFYAEASTDIDRALQNGYPLSKRPKLIERKKLCETSKVEREKFYEPPPKIPKSEQNPHISCARKSVKIMKNEQYGRHVVATRNIEIGEVIAVEQAYAGTINDEMYVHCHECFELCYNLIPCNECSNALYCSLECKNKAYDNYHKYECHILSSVYALLPDFAKRLAVKIAFISRNQWNEDSTDGTFRSDRFKEVSDLETHVTKRKTVDLFTRTAVACGVFYLVKNHTTFFQEYQDEERFKEVILLLLLICATNTVGINEIALSNSGIYNVQPFTTALYPFFTLFSHSCWPNVCRYYHGSTIVLRAVRSIKKNEQCFVGYGPHFAFYPKEFRQGFLANTQFFTCTCRACEERWPTGNEADMSKSLSMLEYFSRKRLAAAEVAAARKEIQFLVMSVKKAEKNLLPWQAFYIIDTLDFCYAIFGNKRRI